MKPLPSLWPPQLRATKACRRELTYRNSTGVAMATGAGKTPIIGALARLELLSLHPGGRVLVTAPRGELLDQAEGWCRQWLPALPASAFGREQGPHVCHNGNRVMFGSLDSLTEERASRMPEPTLWLIDECHLQIDRTLKLAKVWPEAKRVGFSATWDRLDERIIIPDLIEAVHPDSVYEIAEAVRDGYLVRPKFERLRFDCLNDLAGLEQAASGDYEEVGLGKILMREDVVAELAMTLGDFQQAEGRPTVAFCRDIAHAEAMLEAVEKRHATIEADIVTGEMPATMRKTRLRAFHDGYLDLLFSVVLLTYGWDCPRASMIAMLRPTRSRALYCQTIGRGLRRFPGKTNCIVLDFVGNTEDLRLFAPEGVLEPRYGEMTSPGGKPYPADADRELDQEAESGLELDVRGFDSKPMAPPRPGWVLEACRGQLEPLGVEVPQKRDGDPGITFAQQCALEKLTGLQESDFLDLGKQQASELIEEILARRDLGLCTPRQARQLQRRGLNPIASFDRASWALDKIASTGWRLVPHEVRIHPELLVKTTRILRSDEP